MRTATRLLLGALAFVLLGTAARAQNAVTFKVDLGQYITSCQFDPATETVYLRGSFQTPPFSLDNPMTREGSTGIYSTTVSLPAGAVTYKFYVGKTATPSTEGTLGWEGGSDRSYTVVAGPQTVPTATSFQGKSVVNACVPPTPYEVLFQVDMSVQQSRGSFDPATQDVYVVGSFNGWGSGAGNPAYQLTRDVTQPGFVYSGFVNLEALAGDTKYKFVTYTPTAPDGQRIGWESGDDRVLTLTGNEPDTSVPADGRRDVETPKVFFSNLDFNSVLEQPATVTYNVNVGAARNWLTNNPGQPLPKAAGNDETTITSLCINGPAAYESTQGGGPGGGIQDWVSWGDVLEATTEFCDTTADANGNFSLTLNYPVGAARTLVAKFGINGSDNEAAGGTNQNFRINPGTQTIEVVFGAMRRPDGTYNDDNGPTGPNYDPYILVNNVTIPPTATVVSAGGAADNGGVSVGDGPSIAGLEIGSVYPNPVRGRAAVELTLDRALTVSARLYDVTGREVALLTDGNLAAGTTPVSFDASRLSAGVYVLRVEADGQSVSRRLTVVR